MTATWPDGSDGEAPIVPPAMLGLMMMLLLSLMVLLVRLETQEIISGVNIKEPLSTDEGRSPLPPFPCVGVDVRCRCRGCALT